MIDLVRTASGTRMSHSSRSGSSATVSQSNPPASWASLVSKRTTPGGGLYAQVGSSLSFLPAWGADGVFFLPFLAFGLPLRTVRGGSGETDVDDIQETRF